MSKTLAAAAADVTDVPVCASIGLAEWHEGMSARAAVEAADKALREAKGSGGDRVVAAAAPHYRVMKLRHGFRGLRAS
jgi:PleD family two-component response regulator